jgi:hypothetical protein
MAQKAKGADPKYKWVTVQGTECIVWLYNTNDEDLSKSAKRAKRKEKDAVGTQYLDTPMLDTKKAGSGRSYCDIIINSNHVDEWEAVIRKQFITHHQVNKSITGGTQVAFSSSKSSELFVTVNIYIGTRKIMIQPGARKEENLLEWLSFYPAMKAIVLGKSNETRVHNAPVSSQSAVEVDDEAEACSNNITTKEGEGSNDPTTASQQSPANTELKSVSSTTDANTKPKSVSSTPDANINSSVVSALTNTLQFHTPSSEPSSDHSVTPLTGSTPAVHVDELLCFVQNHIESDNLDNIVKICVDFYSDEDIEKSKKLLFDIVKPPNRYIKRRAQDKAKDNIVDICTVFYTLDVAEQPTFTAKSLRKLPPLTVHEFGVGKILCEIQALKMAVSTLQETGTTYNHQPKPHTSASTQTLQEYVPHMAEVSTQAGVNLDDVFVNPVESTPKVMRSSTIPSGNDADDTDNEEELIIVDYTLCNSRAASLSDSLYSDISSTSLCFSDCENSKVITDVSPKGTSSPKPAAATWAQVCSKKSTASSMQHGKKQNSGVVFGNGKSTSVRSVNPQYKVRKTTYSGNRHITGVFLSRLHPHTTPRQLQLHIKHETGIDCRPEKLQTKYGGYSSFFIRALGHSRTTIMDTSLWPVGTLVKPFYS